MSLPSPSFSLWVWGTLESALRTLWTQEDSECSTMNQLVETSLAIQTSVGENLPNGKIPDNNGNAGPHGVKGESFRSLRRGVVEPYSWWLGTREHDSWQIRGVWIKLVFPLAVSFIFCFSLICSLIIDEANKFDFCSCFVILCYAGCKWHLFSFILCTCWKQHRTV